MTAIKEIFDSLKSWKIWGTIALEDVIGKYRRTFLGPVWVVVSQCAFIFGIYAVRRAFSNDSTIDFLLFLAISVPTWNLISSFLNDSASAVLRAKGYIESYPLPVAIYLIRSIMAGLINFLHVFTVFILIAVIKQVHLNVQMLMFFPALLLLLIFGFGACLAISVLGARFRDLGPAINSFSGFMFVFAPVFWNPTPEQVNSLSLKLNPFFYLLEIVRNPLLSIPTPIEYWVISIFITIFTIFAGIITYRIMRPQVVYWM